MAAFGELKPHLNEIARLLRTLVNAQCTGISPSPAVTSAGTGNIPSGFKSITITATTAPATITLSDGSTYSLATVGATFIDTAVAGGTLPTYTISGGAVQWHGIK